MSEATKGLLRTDEADTEVELSAQDLLALSDSGHISKHITAPISPPSRRAISPATVSAPTASSSRLSLSLIVAIGIASATYLLTTSNDAAPSAAIVSDPAPRLATAAKAGGDPVRFANPFDTNEVFEFPPGTSETEARAAVADVLMERAMARQET